MKRLAAIGVLGLILCLTSCVPEYSPHPSDTDVLREAHITLKSGRVVTCVILDNGGYIGGLSCDWSSHD